ncbi:hypothetical protein LRP30_23675 [Bradyrhizobium sp. C-145]|uniref:hypothetical protein n=1 Tax=Bradyrhizobium sp. C-145 TaxID=574727 RepID=UPI00201B8C47|nr:hypothetical protein [Bradyrhizobium sp. C-145]UQR60036.1 hypothetical protein LRP30_23675 [Bradyrhizobium sp. C-145]
MAIRVVSFQPEIKAHMRFGVLLIVGTIADRARGPSWGQVQVRTLYQWRFATRYADCRRDALGVPSVLVQGDDEMRSSGQIVIEAKPEALSINPQSAVIVVDMQNDLALRAGCSRLRASTFPASETPLRPQLATWLQRGMPASALFT